MGNPGLETGVVQGHEAVDVADGAAGPDAPEEPADQHDQVQAERPFHHCGERKTTEDSGERGAVVLMGSMCLHAVGPRPGNSVQHAGGEAEAAEP